MNASLQQLLQQARAAFEQRTPRERALLLGGGGVLLILFLYLGLWEPLMQARERRAQSLDAAHALAIRIETAALLAQTQSGASASNRAAPILSVVDQTSRGTTLGKAPSRVQPDGNGEKSVKIWFEDVSFDNLLRWLSELQTQYGISVSSAEIERGTTSGAVSVRLTLTRA